MTSSDETCILILGCFDTKGDVFGYLRACILACSERVITINTGILGTTSNFPVDYEADAVAIKAGTTIDKLRKYGDRGAAMDRMGKGAALVVAELAADRKIKGIIGMGGGGGTYIALAAMQESPFGMPKLCLSTLAAKDLSRQIGNKDITLMPSIVDVAGLNSIIKVLIGQAAAAICAMTSVNTLPVKKSGCIAISMFGNTTACVDKCTALLTRAGYEVLAFHATGVGGKAMEGFIREGFFDAVLDVTTTELADELCNGICSAGPERVSAAADTGIPQVVVPGCLDMVNFAHLDTVPHQFKDRQLYSWAPDVTLMRTNEEENQILGTRLAQKVNRSAAPATIILPLKGISQIDSFGNVFYHPEINEYLFSAIKENASKAVEVKEVDAHINDPVFAEILVEKLLELLHRTENKFAVKE